jgi:hypothetical protein
MAAADSSKADYKLEVFPANHRRRTDAELLAMHELGTFTAPTLFLCTYVGRLGGLHRQVPELTETLCENPHGCLAAINSNFGHAAQPGYERYIKKPKPVEEEAANYTPSKGRRRKEQGDGTCFNSAVEPVIKIAHDGIAEDKVYFIKCFPTTGEVQVPGVVCPDLSDGPAVIRAFVEYLNELGVGEALDDDDEALQRQQQPARAPITVVSHSPNMLDFKFRLRRNGPRVLIDLRGFAEFLRALEAAKAVAGAPLTAAQAAQLAKWPAAVLPPFPVREVRPSARVSGIRVTFRLAVFKRADGTLRAPRVNVFQTGKVNILGAESVETVQKIYDFFSGLFSANWAHFVSLQPRRDAEIRLRAAAAAAPPRLTDAEVDAVLAEVMGREDLTCFIDDSLPDDEEEFDRDLEKEFEEFE